MTKQDISAILTQIEEWIKTLENDELGEKCRVSGRSFFDFMTQRGQHPGYLARKIQEATGYNPRELHTLADATTLRDAIFRYEASQAAVEHDAMTIKQSLDHFWGE